jgi:hypothetical protein
VDPITMLAIAIVVYGLIMICTGLAPSDGPSSERSPVGIQVAASFVVVVGVVFAFSELY